MAHFTSSLGENEIQRVFGAYLEVSANICSSFMRIGNIRYCSLGCKLYCNPSNVYDVFGAVPTALTKA